MMLIQKWIWHGKLSPKLGSGVGMLTLVNSQAVRQDRTWKSTQDIFFADMKVKAWSASHDIRFSDGPLPPFSSRAKAMKLPDSAQTTAVDEIPEGTIITTRQRESSLGQDTTSVEVARTKKLHSEEPHGGFLQIRPPVAGPIEDLGHPSAEQSLSVPLDAIISNCDSDRTIIPTQPDTRLPNSANPPAVSLHRRIKSPIRSNQTMSLADKSNSSTVDQAESQISALHAEETVAQRSPINMRNDMLRMLEGHNLAGTEATVTNVETDSKRSMVLSRENRVDGTCSHVQNYTLSSGSLGLQCSAPLMHLDLSTSKDLTETEPLYPVVDGSQFVSTQMHFGTNESSGSAMVHNAETSTPSEDVSFTTPLGYHIPKAKLQQAIDAAPSVMAAYWQYTLYRGPGGEKDKVKVHYCKSKDSTERDAQLFLDKEVIGFDIEWTVNATASDGIKKNVALIQIASEERIALFHIARYANATSVDDYVAPTLKRIMESSNITKVGVSVKGDCTRLRKYMNIEARGIFELSHLYKLVKYSCSDVKKINKVLVNLAQQVKEHLQLPLWKGEVRSSDWSQDLNDEQIQCESSCSAPAIKNYPSK